MNGSVVACPAGADVGDGAAPPPPPHPASASEPVRSRTCSPGLNSVRGLIFLLVHVRFELLSVYPAGCLSVKFIPGMAVFTPPFALQQALSVGLPAAPRSGGPRT